MQTLDKEFEVKVKTVVCLLRFRRAEESVGSPGKAAHQLRTASKSILAWKIAFRAEGQSGHIRMPAMVARIVRICTKNALAHQSWSFA